MDLAQYSYSSWYHQYVECAFKSIVIDLTNDFINFLHEDGITVCSSSTALPKRHTPTEIVVEGVDYDPEDTYSSSDDETGSEGSAAQLPWPKRFPELHAAVEAGIEQLGGQVAPKLNWSSPTDALWISSYNSLKCCNADQVILLLKSSDRVMHDLDQLQHLHTAPQQQQQQQQQQPDGAASDSPPQAQQPGSRPLLLPQLVLRHWCDLLPERQFRCFVSAHRLVAVSQRDPSQHFPQLSLPGDLAALKDKVCAFYARSIGSSFPDSSYAMDVYVPPHGPIKLLDFNPITPTTSPLLFTWEELPYHSMHSTQPRQQELEDAGQQQQKCCSMAEQQQEGRAFPAADAAGGGGGVGNVELRVVRHAGMILPGACVATGMPVDMLGLSDAFGEVMIKMQQQETALGA